MFEAGRKNTFAEGTTGQFSYEFREKIRTLMTLMAVVIVK